jgi:ATP phosphoribosyltransferase
MTFLAECGMKVNRSNPRQYLAHINSMPGLAVVFQRAADIPLLVQDGDATLGLTGYDILAEYRGDGDKAVDEDDTGDDDLIILQRDLGYGNCRLVVAVPETWIDVNTCADLWHLAGYYRTHKGRGLRIATKYPALTGQFLRRHGITHCKIITPHGALEAAPLTDTADLIVDLTETGTTLRENRLKLLDDGVVLRSQACLIANARLMSRNEQALQLAVTMLELIDARMQARNRSLLTAYLQAESTDRADSICAELNRRLKRAEASSPTAGGGKLPRSSSTPLPPLRSTPASTSGKRCELRVASSRLIGDTEHNWYTISGEVDAGKGPASELLEIVAVLRSAGAVHISVMPLSYRFTEESVSVRALRERMKRIR